MERKDASDRGVLYAAGMNAGEGIVGIVLAILAVVNVADKLNLSSLYDESGAFQTVGNWVGLIAFVLFYGDEFGGIERKIFLCCGMTAVRAV